MSELADLSPIFENLPGVVFFLKDTKGNIVDCNSLFAKHCGFEDKEKLKGKNDKEVFSSDLAQQYIDDDQKIIKSKQPIYNIVELFPDYLGRPEWFITNKVPFLNDKGEVRAISGTCQSYEGSAHFTKPYRELTVAIEHIKENFHKNLNMADLAKMVKLSQRQFERKFKSIFRITPYQYLIHLRIYKACDLLLKSDKSISDISTELGFYDQSAFGKSFLKHMKVTPKQFQS
jgi:PAS domain S-box-containing protein